MFLGQYYSLPAGILYIIAVAISGNNLNLNMYELTGANITSHLLFSFKHQTTANSFLMDGLTC